MLDTSMDCFSWFHIFNKLFSVFLNLWDSWYSPCGRIPWKQEIIFCWSWFFLYFFVFPQSPYIAYYMLLFPYYLHFKKYIHIHIHKKIMHRYFVVETASFNIHRNLLQLLQLLMTAVTFYWFCIFVTKDIYKKKLKKGELKQEWKCHPHILCC